MDRQRVREDLRGARALSSAVVWVPVVSGAVALAAICLAQRQAG